MGSGWVVRSFDRARWDAIFGSQAAGAEQKIVDAMLWDEDGYFDDSDELGPGYARDDILSSAKGKATRALASHLANNGFTYEGLGEAQSIKLDEFGCHMWSPAGLQEELDAKQLSYSSLTSRAITELLFRAGQFQSLEYLGGEPDPAAIRGASEEFVHAAWMAQRREMQRPASLPRTPVRLLQLLDRDSPETGRCSRTPVGLFRRLLDWGSPPSPPVGGRRFGTEHEIALVGRRRCSGLHNGLIGMLTLITNGTRREEVEGGLRGRWAAAGPNRRAAHTAPACWHGP